VIEYLVKPFEKFKNSLRNGVGHNSSPIPKAIGLLPYNFLDS
jgi:hypothetical protein